MSYFTSTLSVTVVKGGWQLNHALIYYSDFLNRRITVPKGYTTDLASVPRLFRFIVPVANAKNRKAAVVHDYLCDHGYKMGVAQHETDKVFREALGVCGVGRYRSAALYYPVRVYQSIKGVF